MAFRKNGLQKIGFFFTLMRKVFASVSGIYAQTQTIKEKQKRNFISFNGQTVNGQLALIRIISFNPLYFILFYFFAIFRKSTFFIIWTINNINFIQNARLSSLSIPPKKTRKIYIVSQYFLYTLINIKKLSLD